MSIDHATTALQTDLTRLTLVQDAETPVVQLARLQAAQSALKLAAVLLEGTDAQAASEVWDKFSSVTTELARWKRTGRGWFEERLVRRGRKQYGPYRYFRWRDEAGATHTQYLGRVDQAVAEDEQPATPILPRMEQAIEHRGASDTTTQHIAWRKTVQPVRVGTSRKVHLMLPEEGSSAALCGRTLGPDPARAITFQYDDCARCRQHATKLGRVCTNCSEPLILQDAPGLCHTCTLNLQRTP